MTHEKQRPEEDEVSDEQLEGVAGGFVKPVIKETATTYTTTPVVPGTESTFNPADPRWCDPAPEESEIRDPSDPLG